MATSGFTLEIPTKVAASRVFRAGCMDVHKVAPLVLPDLVAGGELLDGDGGVGTIKYLTFTQETGMLAAAAPYKFYKERVDLLDKENFETVYTLVDGGGLGTLVSSAVYRLKLVPTSGGGGCMFKMTAEFVMMPGVDGDAYSEADKEQSVGLFKAIEAYLVANPNAYA